MLLNKQINRAEDAIGDLAYALTLKPKEVIQIIKDGLEVRALREDKPINADHLELIEELETTFSMNVW